MFLREKLDSFSCEGLEKIVEKDAAGVLDLLVDSGVEHSDSRVGKVCANKEEVWPLGGAYGVLRSELNQEISDGANKRRLHAVDASVSEGPPLKSVAFQFGNDGGRLSSAGCEMFGVSDAGQSFPGSSWHDGTSELESVARRWADEPTENRVYNAGKRSLCLLPVQQCSQGWCLGERSIIQVILHGFFQKTVPLKKLLHGLILISKLLGWVPIKWFNFPGLLLVLKFCWPLLGCCRMCC